MRLRIARASACALAILCLSASTAAAQSTHSEWLALRTTKQARHHRLTIAATRPNSLTITTIRFFSDTAGNLVGVGEARNDSNFDLSYSRINFRFFDSNGEDVGGEWAYLFGGTNNRIVNSGAYESVLAPGQTGFFKVWTTIPQGSMSSYAAVTAGEELAVAAPKAAGLVYIGRSPGTIPPTLVGQRFSGLVYNEDPLGPPCPCGHPDVLTYSVRVSVAAYQDGVIADVQSAFAVGPRPAGTQCNGEPTTGMNLHETSAFAIDLARPANRIAHQAVEWEEMDVSPSVFTVSEVGGHASFNVLRQCGWTATSNVPWITVVEGATSSQHSGRVTVRIERNPAAEPRFGDIVISGVRRNVFQAGACIPSSFPNVFFLAAGRITLSAPIPNVPFSCAQDASSDAAWLQVRIIGFDGTLRLSAEPNLTGTTRSTVVRVGASSITVYQSAGSRNVDFNYDGSLDLLWHHVSDGRVAAWRMNGTQLRDGTLLTPNRVPDTSWTPVAAGDLDGNGTTDILWQNTADGRLSFWRMAGTAMLQGELLSPTRVFDTEWKIRAVADLNQDGDPDVVWQHAQTGHVAVWLMRSGDYPIFVATGTPPTQIRGEPVGPGRVSDLDWQIVGTGDFDRDGWPDLVWQHRGDGRIAVWKMHGTTLIAGDLISPGQIHDLDWKIRAVGDINGDDWPDLIWQHRVTGDVSAWLMNGTTMMSGVSLGQVPDTDWQIVGPR